MNEKDRSVRTKLNVKLEWSSPRRQPVQYVVQLGSYWTPDTFLETTVPFAYGDPSFFWIGAVIRSSKTFDDLYDYTWATDVRVDPSTPTPHTAHTHASSPISYLKCRMGGSAGGVICEEHGDNMNLITTLKGNPEPACDNVDQCPTRDSTGSYIITSSASHTSIKSNSPPHIRAIHAKQIYHVG